MLQGVLVESVPCPAPEEPRPEYTKPMVLEGEVLRTLSWIVRGSFFNGTCQWMGKEIRIFPDFDMKNKAPGPAPGM